MGAANGVSSSSSNGTTATTSKRQAVADEGLPAPEDVRLWKTPVRCRLAGLWNAIEEGERLVALPVTPYVIAIGVYLGAFMLALGWWARFPR